MNLRCKLFGHRWGNAQTGTTVVTFVCERCWKSIHRGIVTNPAGFAKFNLPGRRTESNTDRIEGTWKA